MTYQALARKWRPKRFDEVVGQEHVVEALSNALDAERLHHAFLFSGTRGVGKTTLARIFAKAMNCEQGISAVPCQECSVCLSVDEGRFIDLIEVDAASRTGVDDTRELLDNVQYAPTSGRIKVYLIDEIHMLSTHSFNALLKTLEEPPEHVKFLFATTDPQKLPATVLSRCLQFNLRALQVDQIAGQLIKILTAEELSFEQAAVELIARAADGSMRDALSLIDQAIALGGGAVNEQTVRNMLGSVRVQHCRDLIGALLSGEAEALMQAVDAMAEHGVDFTAALDEVLLWLYHLSLAQQLPAALAGKHVDQETVDQYAQAVEPETLQLYYQIGLLGKRDIPLAPDARTGFEMTLLRMLAFQPADAADIASNPAAKPAAAPAADPPAKSGRAPAKPERKPAAVNAHSSDQPDPPTTEAPTPSDAAPGVELGFDWNQVVGELPLTGLARELALHCVPMDMREGRISVLLKNGHKQLHSRNRQNAIATALSKHLGRDIKLTLELGESEQESPAEARARANKERHDATRDALLQEPGVQQLMDQFGASVDDKSIRSNDQ